MSINGSPMDQLAVVTWVALAANTRESNYRVVVEVDDMYPTGSNLELLTKISLNRVT